MLKKKELCPKYDFMIINFFKHLYLLIKTSLTNFLASDNMKYSAALSYYTIFSLAPMLLLAVVMGSVLFGKDAIEGHLFDQLEGLVGAEASLYIENMLSKITLEHNNFIASVIGIGTFIFGATRVFGEIQSTINKIWGLKAKPKKGIIAMIFNRLLSFAMVMSIGFLLIVSLIASSMISILNDQLANWLEYSTFVMSLISNGVGLFIITILFTLIFKFLPDSKVHLKDAFIGSLFTTVLFFIGKYVISMFLITSATASAYGAAGSLIIMLLWVYYSSIILYFGAEFTKSYALMMGHGITPNKFSIRIATQTIQVDQKGSPIAVEEPLKVDV